MTGARPVTPKISPQAVAYGGDGRAAVAYVSPDQNPEQYRQSFDADATVKLLQRAITAIEFGHGVDAVALVGAAWFRVSSFHRSA